jgi:probable blue pigment (indigoidine) exporter
VSLLGLISPIVATVAGLVVLRQTLTPAQLLGAALILTAISVGQRATPAHRHNPAPQPITKENIS